MRTRLGDGAGLPGSTVTFNTPFYDLEKNDVNSLNTNIY